MLWWLWLIGCAANDADRQLTVLAASSLTEAFTEAETAFERSHPGVDVALSFAGSQALATQVRHGIAADVFASANERHLAAVYDEGLTLPPRPLAANELVLAVRSEAITELALLDQVERIVLGAPEVPVGSYADLLLSRAAETYGADWRERVDARVVSREPNVRLVLAKVAMGEADAAIVYRTDGVAAPALHLVPLPLAPRATYTVAQLSAAPEPELAAEWLDWLLSDEGQALLGRHGFASP